MSDHVHIKTPLPIQVGNRQFDLLTFEDLYERCQKNRAFCMRMIAAKERLGTFLEEEKIAMPKKCFELLMKLLHDEEEVNALMEHLDKKFGWPKRGLLLWGKAKSMRGVPCTWPNCPSD
jgi:hypothetical protein